MLVTNSNYSYKDIYIKKFKDNWFICKEIDRSLIVTPSCYDTFKNKEPSFLEVLGKYN